MSRSLTIDVDTDRLFAALDQLTGEQGHAAVTAAARETANRVQTEAKARVARRTGQTAEAIQIESSIWGLGYVVKVEPPRSRIGYWLEYATEKMSAQPFFFAAARLEEHGHRRRLADALQGVIDDLGLT